MKGVYAQKALLTQHSQPTVVELLCLQFCKGLGILRREAKRVKAQGADEAIVLNEQGRVSEGSVTNLLLLLDGEWITPPLSIIHI